MLPAALVNVNSIPNTSAVLCCNLINLYAFVNCVLSKFRQLPHKYLYISLALQYIHTWSPLAILNFLYNQQCHCYQHHDYRWQWHCNAPSSCTLHTSHIIILQYLCICIHHVWQWHQTVQCPPPGHQSPILTYHTWHSQHGQHSAHRMTPELRMLHSLPVCVDARLSSRVLYV